MVTTVGTGEPSGTMPFVKCPTSGRSRSSVRSAVVCSHTIRGIRQAGAMTRTWLGSGLVVSIGWFDTTISSSSRASATR